MGRLVVGDCRLMVAVNCQWEAKLNIRRVWLYLVALHLGLRGTRTLPR